MEKKRQCGILCGTVLRRRDRTALAVYIITLVNGCLSSPIADLQSVDSCQLVVGCWLLATTNSQQPTTKNQQPTTNC
ncbi:MAG: hypothetical protein KDH84_17080, partial [Calditrichaeota bacterium]|nr:hypothetical protein [Calditrichota bacterium]